MITAPSEPCYFFIREHDLRGGRLTPWIITGFDPAPQSRNTHPLTYFTQRNPLYSMGQNSWMPNLDQHLRQAMQQLATRGSHTPRPSTVYELVKLPKRLIDFLSASEVRGVVENIKTSMLHSGNQNLPRHHHGDLLEIQIRALPANDLEAGMFYKNGVSYFHSLEALRQQRQAPPPAPTPPPAPPPPPPQPSAGPQPTPAPQPTVTQQAIRARTRPSRHATVQQQFEYLRRLRKQHEAEEQAANASPIPKEPPKP